MKEDNETSNKLKFYALFPLFSVSLGMISLSNTSKKFREKANGKYFERKLHVNFIFIEKNITGKLLKYHSIIELTY